MNPESSACPLCQHGAIVNMQCNAHDADRADRAEGQHGPDLVGFMAVRHCIDTEFLRTLGGHIG